MGVQTEPSEATQARAGGGGCGGSKGVLGARMMSPWPPAGLNFSGLGKDDVNERRRCFFSFPEEEVATWKSVSETQK